MIPNHFDSANPFLIFYFILRTPPPRRHSGLTRWRVGPCIRGNRAITRASIKLTGCSVHPPAVLLVCAKGRGEVISNLFPFPSAHLRQLEELRRVGAGRQEFTHALEKLCRPPGIPRVQVGSYDPRQLPNLKNS